MSWLNVIAPLLTVILIFIAYLGGKSAGRKEDENKRNKEEQEASDYADKVITSNNMLDIHSLDMWLSSKKSKK